MNHDRIASRWRQLAGKIKEKWSRITDDDLKRGDGNSRYLAGRIQVRYGIRKEAAEMQIRQFQRQL